MSFSYLEYKGSNENSGNNRWRIQSHKCWFYDVVFSEPALTVPLQSLSSFQLQLYTCKKNIVKHFDVSLKEEKLL